MKNSEIIKDFSHQENLNSELRSNYNKVKELQAMVEEKEMSFLRSQKKVVQNLKLKGITTAEIASIFNIPEEEIVKLLS